MTLSPASVAGTQVTDVTTPARSIVPLPQEVNPRAGSVLMVGEIEVVAGEGVDRAAKRALEELLGAYGLTARVVREPEGESARPIIFLGGPGETPASDDALRAFDVEGPETLPSEGYVLVAGRDDRGQPRIVLSGADGVGTFYAVQSLRQLLTTHPSGAKVDAVEIRDWPGYRIRGGMESFYGTVWSQEDRRSQIEFLARHKMNQFFYGPANDGRTGSDWDSPYEEAELARLKEIVDLAHARHVDFVYRVSPEAPVAPTNGICHVSQSDRAKLLARFDQLWSIGVRSFVIAWDDVSGNFTCQEDRDAYGDDVSPLAAAQADVTNFMQREFIETHSGASRLVTVPTEYWGGSQTPYRDRFDELLSTQVDLYWTGPQVVSPEITVADLEAARDAFPRHRLMIWDNYPVNDYASNRLLLGPLVNRDPAMADEVIGISFNELVQNQEVSQIPLGTQADYAWNPTAYDPERSWSRTLQILGGDADEELRLFAENNRTSLLDNTERPEIAALVDRLITEYQAGRQVHRLLGELDAEMRRLEDLPTSLRSRLDNQLLISQIAPWLDRVGVTGQAGRAALGILRAQDRGSSEAAWLARREQARARAVLDGTWHQISPGPIERLLNFAAQQSDSYIGARWYGDLGAPTGTPAAVDGSPLANLADRHPDTLYIADGPPQEGDAITIPITVPHQLMSVTVVQDADAPADGTVQALVDDQWIDLGPLADGFTTVPADGADATALRIRWAVGSSAPRIYEVVPHYADVISGRVSLDPPGSLIAPGSTKRFHVTLEAFDQQMISGLVTATGPDGWMLSPAEQTMRVRADGRTVVAQVPIDVTVPAGTEDGRHQIHVTFDGADDSSVEFAVPVLVGDVTYPQLVDGANPVGYWRLSDPAGTDTAADSSPTGQSGTYLAGAQPGATGVLAGDTAADLTAGYLEVPRTTRTNVTGPFTLEAWVNLDSIAPSPGQAIIESYIGPANNGFALRVDNGVLQGWTLGSPGNGFGVVSGRTQVTMGQWHHVAAVFDGSRLTVYLDGAADNSIATAVSPGDGTASIKLGGRGDDAAQRLRGYLDEAAIYDRALSPTEIEEHYLAGLA